MAAPTGRWRRPCASRRASARRCSRSSRPARPRACRRRSRCPRSSGRCRAEALRARDALGAPQRVLYGCGPSARLAVLRRMNLRSATPGRWRALIALLALLAACGGEQRPPHVILISIDTLRRDALAAFEPGAGALPALDRLAAESVRFEHALSSASWTLPAHASLLTGLYPDRHGATDRRVTLAAEVATLGELLAARGYETAAFTGGGFLDPEYGLG